MPRAGRPPLPRISVGTCGYSYKDWVGPVYPLKTKPVEMLDLYAQRFATVEIDATYYRVPGAQTFESMARRTSESFLFTAKLPGTATHVPDPETRTVHADVPLLRRNLSPLIDAGKLAALLMQFPNSFHPSAATYDYLKMLRDALDDVALVAEFRHREWQTNETIELLRSLNVGLVNVDQPHFKTLMRESSDITSDVAYVRFHGRNAANWWRGTNETRYDYLYGEAELEPWVHRVVDIASNPKVKRILLYFNNHRNGQAVRNAEMLEDMIASVLPDEIRQLRDGTHDAAVDT
jgi:uncharacterized protein YecE (DUF72 family)